MKKVLYYPNADEYAVFGFAKWTEGDPKGKDLALIYRVTHNSDANVNVNYIYILLMHLKWNFL